MYEIGDTIKQKKSKNGDAAKNFENLILCQNSRRKLILRYEIEQNGK